MASQHSLLPDLPHQDRGRGFDPRVIDQGRIDHAAWLAECRRRPRAGSVGRCPDPECGDELLPAEPVHINARRTDYEARCIGCGQHYLAPGGRTSAGSNRASERATSARS